MSLLSRSPSGWPGHAGHDLDRNNYRLHPSSAASGHNRILAAGWAGPVHCSSLGLTLGVVWEAVKSYLQILERVFLDALASTRGYSVRQAPLRPVRRLAHWRSPKRQFSTIANVRQRRVSDIKIDEQGMT